MCLYVCKYVYACLFLKAQYKMYFFLGSLSKQFAKHSPRESLEHVSKEICTKVFDAVLIQALGKRLAGLHREPSIIHLTIKELPSQ